MYICITLLNSNKVAKVSIYSVSSETRRLLVKQNPSDKGIVLVAVILVSAVVLLGVLLTASISSLGTRLGVADERVAYQALLVAEGGINTFEQRIDMLTPDELYLNTLDQSNLNSWLTTTTDPLGQYLSDLTIDGHTTTLTITAVNQASSIATLASTSTVGDGSKSVLVDMYLSRGDWSPTVPAALTSFVPITINGNASVAGQGGSGFNGKVSATTTTSGITLPANTSSTPPFNLMVANTSLLHTGSYLEIDSYTYKVIAKESDNLTLRPLDPVGISSRTIANGSTVNLILSAPATEVPDPVTSSSTQFTVSDASSFMINDTIYTGSFTGTVTILNQDTDTITVTWTGFGPTISSPLAEGTPIRRDVLGAASADTIDSGNDSIQRIFSGESPNDTTLVPSPYGSTNDLFEQTFGMTETELLSLPNVTTITTPTTNVSGITYLNGNWLSSGVKLCGSGVLIITGDARFTDTCAAGFSGIIYSKGEFDSYGNAAIKGAVVTEGSSTTVLNGTATLYKIEYDPKALLEAGLFLAPWDLNTIASTWRQK